MPGKRIRLLTPEQREAKREYNRAYRETHREELAAKYRAWKAANREHLREYNARPEVHARNLETMRAANARRKESRQAYRAERKEHYAALMRQWRLDHPEEWSALTAKTIAKRFGLIDHFTGEQWGALKAACGYRCLRCDGIEPDIKLTVDHIVPLRLGGSNTIDNIQPLCGPCNSRKQTKAIDYRFQLMQLQV